MEKKSRGKPMLSSKAETKKLKDRSNEKLNKRNKLLNNNKIKSRQIYQRWSRDRLSKPLAWLNEQRCWLNV